MIKLRSKHINKPSFFNHYPALVEGDTYEGQIGMRGSSGSILSFIVFVDGLWYACPLDWFEPL